MSKTNCDWCGGRLDSNNTVVEFVGMMTSYEFCSQKCKTAKQNSRNSNSTNGSSSSEGCFVATSVYGNYNHPIVLDLRKFRDNWLANRQVGKKFIGWYYREGPVLATWVDKSKTRKFLALTLIVRPLHFFIKILHLDK